MLTKRIKIIGAANLGMMMSGNPAKLEFTELQPPGNPDSVLHFSRVEGGSDPRHPPPNRHPHRVRSPRHHYQV